MSLPQTGTVKDPVGELEARRVTAERSAKEIQTKGGDAASAARDAYGAAAQAHNAWLSALCERLEAGRGADDALETLAKTATTAFTAWYSARAKALGQTIHPSAASILDVSTQRLLKAAADSSFGSRTDSGQSSAELRRRLTWKPWEQSTGE